MSAERFAVIGDPIAHSLSPAMQGAALSAAGVDADFQAVRVPSHGLGAWVETARREGMRGFNVTIPHKQAVISHLDTVDETAQHVGAVNAVVNDDGHLTGYNTDVEGFTRAVEHVTLGETPERALVFGAGGAARAAVKALVDRGASVVIVNRSQERAAALASLYGDRVVVTSWDAPTLPRLLLGVDLVVNATSLGMQGPAERSPLPDGSALHGHTRILDMVYGCPTRLAAQASAAGCAYSDGIEMLVRQGAAAFRLWTGLEPDLEVMRRACLSHLPKEQPCFAS